MALSIEDAFLPATLTASPMTDEEFAQFCAEHPDLFFEMTAEGKIVVMPPTYSLTGAQNAEIMGQLRNWARRDGRGVANDSSAGFVLPNGARRSPDASWTPKAEIEKLTPESRQSILASLPGVCHRAPVEIGSHSNGSRQNARVYRQLGWLIDPQSRTVEVYRPGRDPETIEGADSVAGEGPVDGFILDLRTVWDPLAS